MSFTRNPNFSGTIKAELGKRLVTAGHKVQGRAVSLIEEPKSGTWHPGNARPSSAPGEAPANQSGELMDSLDTHGPIESESAVEVHVYSWMTRAKMLEAGTATKEPRPFLLPALIQSDSDIMAAMRGEGAANV